MENQKLNLENVSVESFITIVDIKDKKTVKGKAGNVATWEPWRESACIICNKPELTDWYTCLIPIPIHHDEDERSGQPFPILCPNTR